MRSDMFPASSFAKWETVMIAEEMEGEGVAKSDAALNNEAQVEPLEKKGKFEVRLAAVSTLPCSPPVRLLPLHYVSLPVSSLCLTAVVSSFFFYRLSGVGSRGLIWHITVAACKVKTFWD